MTQMEKTKTLTATTEMLFESCHQRQAYQYSAHT